MAARSLFMGAYALKVDAKGRIAMPADFRRELEDEELNGFVAMPSLFGPELDCGGLDFARRVKRMIEQQTDPYSPQRRALNEALIGGSRRVLFDGDGRFILPTPLREHAAYDDRVVLVGLGATFQIRRGESEVPTSAQTLEIARAALIDMKNPVMPVSRRPS